MACHQLYCLCVYMCIEIIVGAVSKNIVYVVLSDFSLQVFVSKVVVGSLKSFVHFFCSFVSRDKNSLQSLVYCKHVYNVHVIN